jgi:hypothetical protein
MKSVTNRNKLLVFFLLSVFFEACIFSTRNKNTLLKSAVPTTKYIWNIDFQRGFDKDNVVIKIKNSSDSLITVLVAPSMTTHLGDEFTSGSVSYVEIDGVFSIIARKGWDGTIVHYTYDEMIKNEKLWSSQHSKDTIHNQHYPIDSLKAEIWVNDTKLVFSYSLEDMRFYGVNYFKEHSAIIIRPNKNPFFYW